MSRTANVFVRVEPEIKEGAEKVLGELGISMSSAVEMFLRQVIAQRGIPFDLKLPERDLPLAFGAMTQEEINRELKKGLDDVDSGNLLSSEELKAKLKQEYGV